MIQCKFLPSLKFCKGSALFLITIDLQFGTVINLDKPPLDTKYELNPFTLAPCAIFKVSDENTTLWRKYLQRVSKWDETFPSSQVSQIASLHPNLVHFIELCEHRSNSWFVSKFSVCEASAFYLAPLWLKIFPGFLLSIWSISSKFWLILISHLPWGFFSSFWAEMIAVKEVPIWQVHLVWNFYSIIVWPNQQALPNFSSIHHSYCVLLHDLVSGPDLAFVLQLC